jgi:hypothetical protein
MAKGFPSITAIPWLPAKEVLGGEASDFTPWLQMPESLAILGAALKLDDLTAIATEHNVLGKRLDILARALDEDGEEIPVCIENQYGVSDADHLGRLIAYLAQQERGRAVWIVEKAHDAFVAGVRFLNRTSTDEVGYYLVQVRFTTAAAGGYHVHFDVLAAPIAWEGSGRRSGGSKLANPDRVDYLEAIHDRVRQPLLDAGFSSMNTHAHGAYLWMRWPKGFWFTPYATRLDIRVTKKDAIVALYIWGFDTKAANVAAAAVLHDELGDVLAAAVPPGTDIGWDAVGSGLRKVIRLSMPGQGYGIGDPDVAASWAEACSTAVLGTLTAHPIPDLAGRIGETVPAPAPADLD